MSVTGYCASLCVGFRNKSKGFEQIYIRCTLVAYTVCPRTNLHRNGRFLPRDAMRKSGLCCRQVSVCPSVRPSRWWIVSTRLKISCNFLFGPEAPSLVYDPWAFQKEPRQQGREVHMWAKFAIFDRNRRLSRKRYEIGPWSLRNVNRKS